VELLGSDEFWPNVLATAEAVALSFFLAMVIGLGSGFLLGMHRLSGEVATPMLTSFYAMPKVTLYPVVLLICGIGLAAKVAFGALHGFLPITISTMSGVRNLAPVYLKTARVLRLKRHVVIWKILIPGSLPEIFTGVRLGFALSFLGTLLGEMFGSKSGLGFMLMGAIGLHQMLMITSLSFLIALFSISVNAVLLQVERKLYAR
jgi:NitT/TauT family transport system permease protein